MIYDWDDKYANFSYLVIYTLLKCHNIPCKCVTLYYASVVKYTL